MYGSTPAPHVAESEPEKNFVESASPYVAEFVGSYLLVFTIGVCSIVANPLWGPTAVGSTLVVLVYIFGPISGAHLNPAVTVACGLAGQISWQKVLSYCILQISAGFVAGLACYAVFQLPMGVSPVDPFSFWDAAFLEVVYTAMLCFVVLSVATSRTNNPANNQNNFFGLAIGLVIIAGGQAAGKISGAVLNPAAAIGLEVAGAARDHSAPYGFAYSAAELFGGIVAAAAFRFVRRHELSESEPSFTSGVFCECFGTFLLCCTIGLSLTQQSDSTPWAAGAALASIVYAVHDVSGGHINPAVTMAVVLSGKCSLERGMVYWAVQLFGGLLAGIATAAYHGIGGIATSNLEPNGDFSWMSVLAVETVFTCILSLVVLKVGPQSNFYFGMAIGSCLTLGGFASAQISGLMNPAVVWSVAIANFTSSITSISLLYHCLAFCLFQLAGGVLAPYLHHLTKEIPYTKFRSVLD
ncbi:Probable aquaporin NIP7-1 (NOD26-like intrinsic protein 7-1) (AtNIP7 [Durusdinium trenchii]|uniref:Probable aquaporin NIP7-1 (NOD26-like intrinsic protein 7-1) (AtNIP7) n=1 Tax=Durusdinium trenchii TaxID=1381693 RepID=A0ABP0JPZ7_9DINO